MVSAWEGDGGVEMVMRDACVSYAQCIVVVSFT